MEGEGDEEDLGDEVWQHFQASQRKPPSMKNQRKRGETIKDILKRRGKKIYEQSIDFKLMAI